MTNNKKGVMSKKGKAKEENLLPAGWDTGTPLTEDITLESLVGRAPFRETKDDQGDYLAAARMPGAYGRYFMILKENKNTPYQTRSDVARDALALGYVILRLRYYSKDSDWAVEGKLQDIANKAQEGTRIRRMFNEFIEGLTDMFEQHDEDYAVMYLSEYIESLVELSEVWKKRTLLRLVQEDRLIKKVIDKCSARAKAIYNGEVTE